MTPPDVTPADAWLEQAAWLRRLARQLVRDPDRAEDAVQETLLAGWRSGRSAGEPSRHWWSQVLRNAVRQDHRARTRREDHELASHEREAEADPTETLARLETQRRVIEAVRALDEPYRTTLVQRFFEERTPRDLARAAGVPVKTVHTRIQRGVQRLRQKLDGEFEGGRSQWMAALLPIASGTAPTLTLSIGALTTASVWKIGTAAALLAGALWVVVPGDRGPSEDVARADEPARVAADAQAALLTEVRSGTDRSPSGRSSAAPVGADEPAPEIAAEQTVLTGFVCDVDGRPVADVPVRFVPSYAHHAEELEPSRPHSDAEGAFSMPVPGVRGQLVADAERWGTLWSPTVLAEPGPAPPIVVVGPSRTYAGLVVDELGAPVPGARLEVVLPAILELPGAPSDRVFAEPVARSTSDDRGRFDLDPLGWVEGIELVARRDGHAEARLTLPPGSDEALTIVVPGSSITPGTLAGRVLDERGQPLADAFVGTTAVTTRTDGDGRFRLDLGPSEPAGILRAVATGRAPVRVQLADMDAAQRTRLEIVLWHPASELEGRVVDETGHPIAGASVFLLDEEAFGPVEGSLGMTQFTVSTTVEKLLAPEGGQATTDERGRFRLTGLTDRRYPIRAEHGETLEWSEVVVASAADGPIELVLDGSEPTRRVAGRVTDSAGRGLPGIQVLFDRRNDDGTGRDGVLAVTETEADGRFAFAELCTTDLHVIARDPRSTAALRRDIAPEEDLAELHIVLPRECAFEVELTDPDFALAFEVLDPAGERLLLHYSLSEFEVGHFRAGLQDGRSGRIRTADTAHALVLYGGPAGSDPAAAELREVARVPISLDPSEVTVLRP